MVGAYRFVTRWRMDADPQRCWAEIERMLRPGAASWWPGVRVPEPPARLAAGERMAFAVRSPLGYRLRMGLLLTEVRPAVALAARSDGDLRGVGRVSLTPAGRDGCEVQIVWSVVTAPAWMNATGGMLRPVFERAHAHVMGAGERGLRRTLAARG